jgi:hypothetical protein
MHLSTRFACSCPFISMHLSTRFACSYPFISMHLSTRFAMFLSIHFNALIDTFRHVPIHSFQCTYRHVSPVPRNFSVSRIFFIIFAIALFTGACLLNFSKKKKNSVYSGRKTSCLRKFPKSTHVLPLTTALRKP